MIETTGEGKSAGATPDGKSRKKKKESYLKIITEIVKLGGSGYYISASTLSLSQASHSIQFSLFPAHINISYSNNNVYILCRKRGGQKTMLMDVRP